MSDSIGRGVWNVGDRIRFTCASLPANEPVRAVWGTDYYTIDSHHCWAALHAGVITRAGGSFIVIITGPRPGFTGSLRNDVQSYDFAQPGNYSIMFTREDATQSATLYDAGSRPPLRPAPGGPPISVDMRFVGTWVCSCNISIVVNADRTGSWVDRRGGPPGSMYATATLVGTWTSSGDGMTLSLPVAKYGNRGGSIAFSLVDGKLRDPWGDIYTR